VAIVQAIESADGNHCISESRQLLYIEVDFHFLVVQNYLKIYKWKIGN